MLLTFLSVHPSNPGVRRDGWYLTAGRSDRVVAGPFATAAEASRAAAAPVRVGDRTFRERAMATPCPRHANGCDAVGLDAGRRLTWRCGHRDHVDSPAVRRLMPSSPMSWEA